MIHFRAISLLSAWWQRRFQLRVYLTAIPPQRRLERYYFLRLAYLCGEHSTTSQHHSLHLNLPVWVMLASSSLWTGGDITPPHPAPHPWARQRSSNADKWPCFWASHPDKFHSHVCICLHLDPPLHHRSWVRSDLRSPRAAVHGLVGGWGVS